MDFSELHTKCEVFTVSLAAPLTVLDWNPKIMFPSLDIVTNNSVSILPLFMRMKDILSSIVLLKSNTLMLILLHL